MSRLLVVKENAWYYKLSDVAFYDEAQFEAMVLGHVKSIFPDYLAIPFKKGIKQQRVGKMKPDIALIRLDFKEWWVVEVELEDHPLDHVKKQVRIFLNGDYTDPDEYVQYMSKQIKIHHKQIKNPETKIRRLLKNHSPSVLVIVDGKKEEWELEFRRMNVTVCVMEVYRNNRSRYSYRLAGNYPYVVKKESPCRFDPKLSNVLQIIERRILDGKVNNKGEIEITYDNELTRWLVIKDSKQTYLKYRGPEIPLNVMNSFVLRMSSRGQLYLERS